ncbi:unnamed protein product [Prunus armeniaca]
MPPTPLSQDSTVVTELAVVEAIATNAPSPPLVSSTVLTELVVSEVLGALSAAENSHNTEDCISMRKIVERLIREGKLDQYIARPQQALSAEAPYWRDPLTDP